ncbi:flagellar hook-basal body complex protein [Bradyrhizobium sp. S69]|jgi:flagellar hook protein FlgE|uniref:flagellar hook-basal body complex protein n=1 Tax=Bradyrhizobium sp. S69 TaxID=1641856 RepID=UPI00131C21AC|nr:flagellar hook-basal body complex protein [Bradyrhizobium sp. S69]
MGIFDALNTAVGGLQSQSYALQNISGNIANASTIGYKGIDTTFEDLVAQSSGPTSQVAGGVQAFSQQTLTTAGTVTASTVATNMAINGDGFFSVQKPTSTVDNQPVFNGVTDYTRAGDFQVNANGNLVNGAGYYLMGVTVDPKTGNPLGSVANVLQFQNNFIPAQATSTLQYAANLPTTPTTTASATAAAGTITAAGGLNTGDFTENPTVLGTPPQPYGNSSATGTAEAGTTGPISAATLLSSAATGSATGTAVTVGGTAITGATVLSTMSPAFTNGSTLVVNGKTITFSSTATTSTSSTGGTISLSGTVQDILTAIDQISGTSATTAPSTISGTGAITLNDNAGNLTITSSPASDLAVLGFSGSSITTPNALASSYAATDSITVTTSTGPVTIAFYNGGTAPTDTATTKYLNLANANVGDLLHTIDLITGNTTASTASSVSSTGAVTLDTGTANDLSIFSSAAGWGAMGLTSPETAKRSGGGGSGQGFVTGADSTAFTNESISGGAVTAYNASGTPVNLQMRWALTSTAGGQETWNLFYQTDTTATGTQVAWQNVGTNFVFNSNGALTSPSGAGITIPGVTVNNQLLGDVTLNVGSSGLTNFATTTGAATVNNFTQNGYAAGQLQSVAINDNGLVVGTFSNGQNLDLAQVTLSHFNGTNYLQALSGEAYAVTEQSGPAIAGASGTISGSSLEGSNTDIADEFTKLIVTQQAYSANTKVITTANDMVQDLLNVLR